MTKNNNYVNLINEGNFKELKKLIKKEFLLNNISEDSICSGIDDNEYKKLLRDLLEEIKSELSIKSETNWLTNQSFEQLYVDNMLNDYSLSERTKINKGALLLKKAFIDNLENPDSLRLQFIATKYAEKLYKKEADDFAKAIRLKTKGLKKNYDICKQISIGEITPIEFTQMSNDDFKTQEIKEKEKKIIEDSIQASKQPKVEAETDMFRCAKCKKNKTTYRQQQTRSCDEPMTTIVVCSYCGNTWRF